MKLLLIFVAAAFFAMPSLAQQQSLPSNAKCRADLTIWYNTELEANYRAAQTAFIKSGKSDAAANTSDIAKVPIKEVVARVQELYVCAKLVGSPSSSASDSFYRAGAFYTDVFSDRFVDFVDRHELRPQLYQEDEAGKR